MAVWATASLPLAAAAQSTLSVPTGQCVDGQCRIDAAAPLAGMSPAPLLQYRKGDDATPNPLRSQSPPPTVVPAAAMTPPSTAPAASASEAPRYDSAVQPAVAAEPLAANEYAAAEPVSPAKIDATVVEPPPAPLSSYDAVDRRLAPPSSTATGDAPRQSSRARYTLSGAFSQLKSLSTAGSGLAIVIGLLAATVWLLRRSGPKPSGVLPAEAFAVLGRAPLTSQSFAQLLRIGNKLVLVAMTAEGAQPLAEVTDPAEVDRIAGLCISGRPGGSSAEFQQVLAQLSREPARGFLGREGSSARRR